VNKFLLSSAVAAAIFAIGFVGHTTTSAQQQPGAGQSLQPYVYLVDMNYLFKKHARLSAERKALTAEADALQKQFEEQMRGVQERSKPLAPGGLLKVGTDEYNRLEEQINKDKATIQTGIAHKRREFILRESHLLFTAYTEISQEVKYYCEQHGIAIVINFNGDTMKEDNPDDVARGISRQVVYYNKALDITPYILPRIQGHEPPANPGPAAFTPPNYK
jgi:Skp family chaperone for outer membrane proteins